MKKYSILLFYLMFSILEVQATTPIDSLLITVDSIPVDASLQETEKIDTVHRKVKNGAWILPSSATTINGWAIGWLVSGTFDNKVKNINGIHTQISPLTIFLSMAAPITLVNMFDTNSHLSKIASDTIFVIPKSEGRMNGLSLSIIDFDELAYTANGMDVSVVLRARNIMNGIAVNGLYYQTEKSNGLMISGLGGCATQLNGVSISGVCNIANIVRGIQVGGYNRSNEVHGIQIGLFNKTNKLKGVQIGLFNKNGKLGLPLINIGW